MSPKEFTYAPASDAGKAHPETIRPGLTKVKRVGGSYPDNSSVPTLRPSRGPKGVKKMSGTERLKTNTRRLQAKANTKQPKVSGSSIPAGVRKHSGIRAPKRVK